MNWLFGTLFPIAHAASTFGASADSASDDCTKPGSLKLCNPLGVSSISGALDSILTFLIYICVPVAAIMVLYGGFQILTAGGNENMFTTGRKTITYAVVGLGIILIAKGATLILKQFLGG